MGPTGDAPKGPFYFATWDPDGGRFAMLAGDLASGEDIRVVLIDPSRRDARSRSRSIARSSRRPRPGSTTIGSSSSLAMPPRR